MRPIHRCVSKTINTCIKEEEMTLEHALIALKLDEQYMRASKSYWVQLYTFSLVSPDLLFFKTVTHPASVKYENRLINVLLKRSES